MNNESKVAEISIFQSQLEALDNVLNEYNTLNVPDKNSSNMIDWFTEIMYKNLAIYRSKKDRTKVDQESYHKTRGNVYWIDFGKTIGSEFEDEHFAVVLKELDYVAVVVPLTTKKEKIPKWIIDSDCVIDIGVVNGFPYECKECYAYVGGICSVSKKRLSIYGDKKLRKYYPINLTSQQMSKIEDLIIERICGKLLTSTD